MSDNLHVGEHGKALKVETGQDLSGYTLGEISIEVRLPDKTTASWAATRLSNGETTSSVIEYDLQDGDLPLRGNYIIHAQVDSAAPDVKEIGEPTTVRVLDYFENIR